MWFFPMLYVLVDSKGVRVKDVWETTWSGIVAL